MKGVVNGIVSRKKEDGKIATMLYLSGIGMTAYDQEADVCKGNMVAQVYYTKLLDCNPGDTVDVEYIPGFQGKAQVSNITVIKRKEIKS